MGQVIVRNLDDAIIAGLKRRAEQRKVSLEQHLRDVLREAANLNRDEIVREAQRIRAMVPPSSLDSTELIREDRDNDEPHR